MIVDADGVIEMPIHCRVFASGFRIEEYTSVGVLVRRESGFMLRESLARARQLSNLEARIKLQESK